MCRILLGGNQNLIIPNKDSLVAIITSCSGSESVCNRRSALGLLLMILIDNYRELIRFRLDFVLLRCTSLNCFSCIKDTTCVCCVHSVETASLSGLLLDCNNE